MTETKLDSTRRVFGLDSDTLISRLEKKKIRVVALGNVEVIGVLAGATPYSLTVLVDGVPVIVNKGAIITIQPVTNGTS